MALGKKGSITDLPYIISGIFAVALVALLVTHVVSNLNDQVQDNEVFNAGAKSASELMVDDIPNVMDGGIVFIFFAMVIISLVLASLVPVHPVFLIFYILEWVLLIWIGAGIANTYQTISEVSVLASTVAQYDFTIFFFQYFPYAVGFAGAILAMVMYKVKRGFVEG